jgi:hypothetical protein
MTIISVVVKLLFYFNGKNIFYILICGVRPHLRIASKISYCKISYSTVFPVTHIVFCFCPEDRVRRSGPELLPISSHPHRLLFLPRGPRAWVKSLSCCPFGFIDFHAARCVPPFDFHWALKYSCTKLSPVFTWPAFVWVPKLMNQQFPSARVVQTVVLKRLKEVFALFSCFGLVRDCCREKLVLFLCRQIKGTSFPRISPCFHVVF